MTVYDLILVARESLGWTTEEFFDATPRFFSEMLTAKTKSLKQVDHGKPKENKTYYWDEIKAEVM